jgi:hypothetical protein
MKRSISDFRILGAVISIFGGVIGCAISTAKTGNGGEMAGIIIVALTAFFLFNPRSFDNDKVAGVIGIISGLCYLTIGSVAAGVVKPDIVWAYCAVLFMVMLLAIDWSHVGRYL